jgi:hypothetical protein
MKPQITLGVVTNVFTRMMHFVKQGDEDIGLKHTRDHLIMLASGSLKVVVNEAETVFNAPHMIFIGAGKNFRLVALADDTVATSIHAIRESSTGNIIDPSMIPDGMRPDMQALNAEPFVTDIN